MKRLLIQALSFTLATALSACGESSNAILTPNTTTKKAPSAPHHKGTKHTNDLVACPFSISSNFNGTAIPAGRTIWFSAVAKAGNLGSSPVTVYISNATVSFTAGNTPYTLDLPNSAVTFDPNATAATVSYGATTGWTETVPANIGGNVLLDAGQYAVSTDLPGGIQNVTLSGDFNATAAGVKLNWAWSAAAYSQFDSNDAQVGVKPVDSNVASQYKNSDHAGTPENEKSFVVGGARGGGGSNYTGGLSGTDSATPCLGSPTPQPSPTPAGSEFVYVSNVGANNVSGYAIDANNGALNAIPGSPFLNGTGYGVATDPLGKFLYANGVNTNSLVFGSDIDAGTGAPASAIPGSPFQTGSGPNSVLVSPNGRFAYVVANGDNTISAYSINSGSGSLTPSPNSPYSAESQPDGIAIDPLSKFVYVANWDPGTISGYNINQIDGSLTPLAGSPFPGPGHGAAGMAIAPSGKFLYAAGIYGNEIGAYAISPTTGALTEISGSPFNVGNHIVDVAIDPTGKFLYAPVGPGAPTPATVDAFTIDSGTGGLTLIGSAAAGAGGGEVAIDPLGKYVYVPNQGDDTVSAFAINATTGMLTVVPGSPFTSVGAPSSIAVTRIGGAQAQVRTLKTHKRIR